ncbi:MAG TPA: amidohydrolase family protein [Gemmatimonadales bacterium]|nr:amidohydrolase family protein [Gemmatimonadales bacterium]
MVPPLRLSAPWLYPAGGSEVSAIEDGALLIDEAGRLAAMGPDATVPAPAGCRREHYAQTVIMPGLVNTHTHLELTGFEDRVLDEDFASWIRHLRALKEQRMPEEFLAAARRGLADCFAAGVTTVADTGDSGAVIRALAEAGGSGIAYQEVFGPHPDQCESSLIGLQARVAELRRFASPRIRLGVSPHAPYTVSEPLATAVMNWARAEGLPVAVHIAESPAEREFLLQATGPFAAAWKTRQIPLPPRPGSSPIAWLESSGGLTPDTLCIHAVQVDAEDIAELARADCAIAHCPGSNLRHRHGDAPLAAFLEAGLRVGVGTDSVASVGRLDLLAEARRARTLAGLSAAAALDLCTAAAARALGLDGAVGRLAPGLWGDVTLVRVGAVTDPSDIPEALLESSPGQVVATYVGGRKVHSLAT